MAYPIGYLETKPPKKAIVREKKWLQQVWQG